MQDTFIVSTTEDEVFFLDQHVVPRARVVFEQAARPARGGTAGLAVALLFPETLELGPARARCLERWRRAARASWASAFEDSAATRVVLRAVPTLLKGDEPERLIEAAVDELAGPRSASRRSIARWPFVALPRRR